MGLPASKEWVQHPLLSLQRSLEITRDARFHANSRLISRNLGSAYAVSLLSMGVIFVSLLPNVYRLSHEGGQLLLACSIALSVFIIIYSLLDSSNNFYHKSELLHDCARKVNGLLHESYSINPASKTLAEEVTAIWSKYQKVLFDCPVNHGEVDFLSVKIKKPALFENYYSKTSFVKFLQRTVDRFRYYGMRYGWLVPPAIVSGLIIWVVLGVVPDHITDAVVDSSAAPGKG